MKYFLMQSTKNQEFFVLGLISLALTLPVLGFVYGIIASLKDNGLSIGSAFFSLFVVIFYAATNVFGLGKVPLDEAGVNYADLRVYIVPTYIVIFILLWLIRTFVFKKPL